MKARWYFHLSYSLKVVIQENEHKYAKGIVGYTDGFIRATPGSEHLGFIPLRCKLTPSGIDRVLQLARNNEFVLKLNEIINTVKNKDILKFKMRNVINGILWSLLFHWYQFLPKHLEQFCILSCSINTCWMNGNEW